MTETFWSKDPAGFHVLADCSLEMPFARQQDYLTPNPCFFVCNERPTPRVEVSSYRLSVEGDAISRGLELSYDDLKAMPQRSVLALIECAGNQRMLFESVLGERLDKRPHMTEIMWGLGGAGMAEWTGVALRDVLKLAGIRPQAIHVCPVGLDRGGQADEGVKCPMPVGKALDPDTLLALEMNGEPLPPDHGFPVRLIVPGWVGTYSIKWVDRITVSSRFMWVFRNTEQYVLMGDEWPESKYAPARGAPITEQSIKSSLALEWPARMKAGPQRLFGYARAPDSEIRGVEWSDDGGATWRHADLISPNLRYAWTRFSLSWDASPGQHAIMTRATDRAGRKQPMRIPFNNGGYLFNMVHPHPIIVADA